MVAHKLRTFVLSILSFGLLFTASAADFQGIPLPENTSIALVAIGEGVQIYESKLNSMGTFEWALKAPEAALKNLDGEVLGKTGANWSEICRRSRRLARPTAGTFPGC
jgi:hypothetical protein